MSNTRTHKKTGNSAQVDMKRFYTTARDLLGFIRVENQILEAEGSLTLRGLYMQKMAFMKDLEEELELLLTNEGEADVVEGVILLKNIQAELQKNTRSHLSALDKLGAVGVAASNTEAGHETGDVICH